MKLLVTVSIFAAVALAIELPEQFKTAPFLESSARSGSNEVPQYPAKYSFKKFVEIDGQSSYSQIVAVDTLRERKALISDDGMYFIQNHELNYDVFGALTECFHWSSSTPLYPAVDDGAEYMGDMDHCTIDGSPCQIWNIYHEDFGVDVTYFWDAVTGFPVRINFMYETVTGEVLNMVETFEETTTEVEEKYFELDELCTGPPTHPMPLTYEYELLVTVSSEDDPLHDSLKGPFTASETFNNWMYDLQYWDADSETWNRGYKLSLGDDDITYEYYPTVGDCQVLDKAEDIPTPFAWSEDHHFTRVEPCVNDNVFECTVFERQISDDLLEVVHYNEALQVPDCRARHGKHDTVFTWNYMNWSLYEPYSDWEVIDECKDA